ncbi:EscU/YscU/HrcU family type III secretion system export apparatus switch protein [Malaciobacter sp. WC5094]
MQKEIKQENYTTKAAALKYDINNDSAPKVTAKGKGETANNIIKIARENNIPIKKDEDLVELLSQLDLDKEIPGSMYKAVAEIFSFIYDMTNQGKKIDEKLEEKIEKRLINI